MTRFQFYGKESSEGTSETSKSAVIIKQTVSAIKNKSTRTERREKKSIRATYVCIIPTSPISCLQAPNTSSFSSHIPNSRRKFRFFSTGRRIRC
ncbi:hypothetical protein S83_010357 [Arachis hypogaea]